MDAVTAIMNDHRVMESLFDRLKAGEGDRAELVAEVKARLKSHSLAEEEHVYTALTKTDPAEKDEVYHGVKEHREADQKLSALEAAVEATPDGPDFDTALTEFLDAVTHHVEEEESEILPSLRSAMSESRLEELGKVFEERRRYELKGFGITESAAVPGTVDESATKSTTA